MALDRGYKPRLRPSVQPVSLPQTPPGEISLCDSTGMSGAVITLSQAAMWIVGHFDGRHTVENVCEEFHSVAGRPIETRAVENLVAQLDRCLLLESPAFEAHYNALAEHYRSLPARPGLPMNLPGGDDDLPRVLDDILRSAASIDADDRVVGLIAPHLDYPRGAPCYAAAYGHLARRRAPDRVVILGTNHSPRGPSPVATGRDFATLLGRTRTDVAFIEQLEARCGNLRRCELDHAREHSVELQLLWCQHLFGADRFDLVPILCPDPGLSDDVFPDAMESAHPDELAAALRELITRDGRDTLVVAGADLSHVGAAFGDQRRVDAEFLAEVRRQDDSALAHLRNNDPDAFLRFFLACDNPTRVCSIGCVYTLMKVFPDASVTVLGYHQAVDPKTQTGVTCAAAVFRR